MIEGITTYGSTELMDYLAEVIDPVFICTIGTTETSSIPAIFGAFLVQFKDIGVSMGSDGAAVILGFLAAFISGYFAIKWLIDLIQNKSLDFFSYYCWIVGIVVFMGSITHIF